MKPPARGINLAEHRDNFLKQSAALNRHAIEARWIKVGPGFLTGPWCGIYKELAPIRRFIISRRWRLGSARTLILQGHLWSRRPETGKIFYFRNFWAIILLENPYHVL